ncbi:hypothetical protein F4778DRAFT_720361 [Xylariomycetidae sp. FL2044]|nr:hypothetical protein F4778DRAFT_720361 [Xylariomycetidae sp. FL2044]
MCALHRQLLNVRESLTKIDASLRVLRKESSSKQRDDVSVLCEHSSSSCLPPALSETRPRPSSTMSTSDRRRGTSHHNLRSSASGSSRSSSSVIAPPPRAQLTGAPSASPSPGPENDAPGSGHHEPALTSNKESGSALAAKGKESVLLLKEKDDKIAELKRELSLMEAEFLRELDHLSQNESDSTSFWQSKYSSLNAQLLKADAELELLRTEVNVREADRVELREGWEALRRQLRERDDEVRSLRAQISGLKQWVSTSTTRGDQTSDDAFGDAAAKLGNGLQNWVIVHFRRAKLDFSRADEAIIDDLSELVPMYEELAAPAKIHLLQSIVSSIWVDMIFRAYFVGIPEEQAIHLSEAEKYMASTCSTETVNQWRALTLTMLQKETVKMREATDAAVERVVSRTNRVLDAITITIDGGGGGGGSGGPSASASASASVARDQTLRALVGSAVELARSLRAQKALFAVTMPRVLPHQRVPFEPLLMEDVGGEEDDDEGLAAREIGCVTFPGIVKTGDENGAHLHFQNVVAKARVLCSSCSSGRG